LRLVKAKLANYRKFTLQEILFDRPITVLVGRNNSGKTTILEALGVLFQVLSGPIPVNKRINKPGEIAAYAQVQLRFNDQEWIRITELVAAGYPQFNDELKLDTIMSLLVNSSIDYRWTSKYVGGIYQTGQDSRTIGFSNTDTLSKLSDTQSTIISAGLDRLLSIHLGKFLGVIHMSSERYLPLEEKFIPFEELSSVEENKRAQYLRNNLYQLRKTAPSKYEAMVGIFRRLFELSHVDNFLDENSGKIELNFTEGNIVSNLLEMGAGVTSLVTMFGRIMTPGISLALLDEPDINLHPGLVRELISFLRDIQDTTQLVVSSHNQTFVNSVERVEILHVKTSSSYSSTVSELETDEEMMDVFDDLGVRLENYEVSEALTGGIIILGEGNSDWEYLKELAKKANFLEKLLSLTSAYVPLGGKKLIDSNLLDKIKGSKTNFILIRDRDEYNNAEISELENNIGKDRLHFLQRREMENYLLDYQALHKLISNKLQKKSMGLQLELSDLKSNIKNLANSLKRKVILLKFVHNIPGLTLLSGEEIHLFIERNISKSNYDVVNDFSGNVLEKVTTLNRTKLKDILNVQENEVEQNWTEEGILKICPGKDLLKLIRKWVKREYDIEILPYELIDSLDSLNDDIRELFQKISKLTPNK
jgi:ABC-type branched-subunit amino acid transport system ATPase component